MTDPAITAALRKLIASTPPPVTVWGVRFTEPFDGIDNDGNTCTFPAGYTTWLDSEAEARELLADAEGNDEPVELVRVTGRVHVEG